MLVKYIVTEDTFVLRADGHGDAVLAVGAVLANCWPSVEADVRKVKPQRARN
jgi:hypothetical protein